MAIVGTAYGRAKQRHNTAAGLASANPIPAAAEIVAAVDGDALVYVRMGDGVTHWNDLPNIFPSSGGGGGGGLVIVQTTDPGGPVGQLWYDTDAGV